MIENVIDSEKKKSYSFDDLHPFEKQIQRMLPNHDVRDIKFQKSLYSHSGVIGELSQELYYLPHEKCSVIVNMNNVSVRHVEIV